MSDSAQQNVMIPVPIPVLGITSAEPKDVEAQKPEQQPAPTTGDDTVTEPVKAEVRYKYSRDELIQLGKGLKNAPYPKGLDLSAPDQRDLDKKIPYERGAHGLIESSSSDPSLKPSWAAVGRFGQQANKHADSSGISKSPPPGFGLPPSLIRSRLVEDGALHDDDAPQRGLGLGRLGGPAPWRGQDKDADRDRPRDRHGQPWNADSPPEGRMDAMMADRIKGGSPPDGRRQQGDRWDKQSDTWRAGAAQQAAPAKDAWRGNSSDRWGNGNDERPAQNQNPAQRRGGGAGGWADDASSERRRPDNRHDGGNWDDGDGTDIFQATQARKPAHNQGRMMTAADIEAERLAYRKKLEEEKQRKKQENPSGLRSIYDHDEVDLSEMMDESQKEAVSAEPHRAPQLAGPPGFAHPGQGVKMSFAQLAQAAPASGAAGPPIQNSQPNAISLDELEKRLTAGPGSIAAAAGASVNAAANASAAAALNAPAHPQPGAPLGPVGGFGFKADTQASMALLGMLGKGQAPAAAAAVPAQSQVADAVTAPTDPSADKPCPALGADLAPAGSKIPKSVLSAFGEGSAKDLYAAFPSLSSIWGAPAGGAQQQQQQQAAQDGAAAGHQALPPATQTAAAALYEQLSNAAYQAAAGTYVRPPTSVHPQQQQQQRQQAASDAIMALLSKTGQQHPAPKDAGLQAVLGQLGRAVPGQPWPQPQGAAGAGTATAGSDQSGSAALVDDNLNSMLKDLGISPEPSKNKEQEAPPGAGTGWGQQLRPTPNPPAQQPAKTLQDILNMQRAPQDHQAQMQQLQQLLVNGQQQHRANMQAALQQQQQQQPQQQQWPANMLHAMQMQGMRPPGQPAQQQQQQQGAGFPANFMQQQQQQQQMLQQRMQQQHNMAAAMQAAAQQQQRPQQSGFDPALLARLQGGMAMGGAGVPGAMRPGMPHNPSGNPLASALTIQQMMQMQQQLQARGGAPPGAGMAGNAQHQADPNNLARFFNAAALQQAQAVAARGPQGAAPTVSDLERLLGQRR